jgi:hypothetical protein
MFKLAKTLNQPGQGEASIGQVARAISWSFFGVRKGEDLDRDAAKISPMQIIAAGLIGTTILHAAIFGAARYIAPPPQYNTYEMSEMRELAMQQSDSASVNR